MDVKIKSQRGCSGTKISLVTIKILKCVDFKSMHDILADTVLFTILVPFGLKRPNVKLVMLTILKFTSATCKN